MTDFWGQYDVPVPLTQVHDLSRFDSGYRVLDDWLRQRALQNMSLGASRTYVVCPAASPQVVAYFSLSMGQAPAMEVPGSMRRNMPKNIPAVVLGRLAVDRTAQGRGMGRALLAEILQVALRGAREISARILLVQALSPEAEAFYLRNGFTRMPGEAAMLALDLVKVGKATA